MFLIQNQHVLILLYFSTNSSKATLWTSCSLAIFCLWAIVYSDASVSNSKTPPASDIFSFLLCLMKLTIPFFIKVSKLLSNSCIFQEISKPIVMLCMDTTKFTKSGYIMSKAMDKNRYKSSLNIKLYIKLVTEGLQLTDHH